MQFAPTLALALAVPTLATAQEAVDEPAGFVFDERAAEHLLNRAGFGARPNEARLAVELGHEAFVELLLAGPGADADPFYADWLSMQGQGAEVRDMPREERQKMSRQMRRKDTRQLDDFTRWWVDRMVAGEHPLQERMTLFWHGYFTSSFQDVRNSFEMIAQNQLFRENGLGRFDELLRSIARDPAMLEYLDNDANRKGNPNENFARELMELFTLGEGHYTEDDIKEAARAFTGWMDRNGRFVFTRRRHDDGEKTVLGTTGTLDGGDVLGILLEQDACPRYVAGKLLTYFEGRTPPEQRLARYADVLRANDWRIDTFLRELFLDPDFYSAGVVGARIASPVDFLVGSARRLGVDAPAELLITGSAMLGQRLLYPPNVKGWDGGQAWITTSTLMQRGNLAGLMLGVVTVDDVLSAEPDAGTMDEAVLDEEMDGMDPEMDGDAADAPRKPRADLGIARKLKALERAGWRPRVNLSARVARSGAKSEREIVARLVDDLLAVDVTDDTLAYLSDYLREERKAAGLERADLRRDPRRAEMVLRKLAHLVLCLPEAQLN